MAISYFIEDKENIPEAFVNEYKEVENGFVLDVEGVKSLEEYKEIYDASENFKTEINNLKQTLSLYGENTPEKVSELESELKIALGKIDEAADPTEVQKKAEEIAKHITKDKDKKIKELEESFSSLSNENKNLKDSIQFNNMKNKIGELTKGKINDYSFDDIVLRAKADGIMFREDKKDFYQPTTAMSIEQWLSKVLDNNPQYAKFSESGGARGGLGNKGKKPNDMKSIVSSLINK